MQRAWSEAGGCGRDLPPWRYSARAWARPCTTCSDMEANPAATGHRRFPEAPAASTLLTLSACPPGQTCPASPAELGSPQGAGSSSPVRRTRGSAGNHRVLAPTAFGGHCRHILLGAGCVPSSDSFPVGISLRKHVLCPETACRAGLGLQSGPSPLAQSQLARQKA